MSDPITSFRGPHRFLSNFAPCVVFLEGELCDTAEHAYQAGKFSIDDPDRAKVLAAETPGAAKRLGNKAPDRSERFKLALMERVLRMKFSQDINPDLWKKLQDTGRDRKLIEGNHWGDKFWGVCNGEGENHLGEILTKIRGEG